MNKKIILIAVLLLATGSFAYFMMPKDESQSTSQVHQNNLNQNRPQKARSKSRVTPKELNGYQTISWGTLYKLDYKTGKAPDEVKALHGMKVKLPGFLVPLSDNNSELSEFLIVPDGQSCIHVPPPPPNLIVHSKMKESIPVREAFSPAWVYGTLSIETTKSIYGAASYKMSVDRLIEYH